MVWAALFDCSGTDWPRGYPYSAVLTILNLKSRAMLLAFVPIALLE